ncbi:hypothetical protein L6452_17761 [Arctium lappa]|uniref:Uncharacterized protein n=1 Tax=Arctium lappa TaxID=4217 RepID=A0ACB9C4B6_ARCLA|nr:hypothetical protein L6452_17761 [Arctium lappa]
MCDCNALSSDVVPLFGDFNLASILAARICDLVTSGITLNVSGIESDSFDFNITLESFGDQNETEWEYSMTLPVVPMENPFYYLPLTTRRLSHESDNPQI